MKTTPEPTPLPSVGARLVGALQELNDVLAAGRDPTTVFTSRAYEVPEPPPFDPKAVLRVRTRIGASQAVFAKIIGSSAVLVQGWEQGKRTPSPMARRLLQAIEANPKMWAAMVAPKKIAGPATIHSFGQKLQPARAARSATKLSAVAGRVGFAGRKAGKTVVR